MPHFENGRTYEVSRPEHPELRNEIIRFYANALINETGFDYFRSQEAYQAIGNTPGVEPDVCLLLYRLIKQYNIKKIVELGSGFTTLVFTHIIEKLGGELTSYDQDSSWLEKTQLLLSRYNKPFSNVHLFNNKTDENMIGDADFVFVDFMDRSHIIRGHSDWFSNAKIVVMDDGTTTPGANGMLYDFMTKSKRHNFITYNGTGRTDRIQFISYLDVEPPLHYFVGESMAYM